MQELPQHVPEMVIGVPVSPSRRHPTHDPPMVQSESNVQAMFAARQAFSVHVASAPQQTPSQQGPGQTPFVAPGPLQIWIGLTHVPLKHCVPSMQQVSPQSTPSYPGPPEPQQRYPPPTDSSL
jgi:hypothetical protein